MGIYGALATAVTGMQAQSFALEHISGNIANSQTTGYKRTDTSFVDLVPDSPPTRQNAGAVLGYSRATNTVQGDIKTAQEQTFLAINGDGFFAVENSVSETDDKLVFSGVERYTRRGDFTLDKRGYLVNGAGYYLKGLEIDRVTGNVSSSISKPVQITNDFLAPKPTTTINFNGNLPSYPLTANADKNVANSELVSGALLDGNNDVLGANADDFLKSSIAGGAVTVYDSSGAPVNVQFRWAKTANTPNDTWNMFYMENSNAGAGDVAWRNVDQSYVFGANGKLTPAVTDVTINALTVNGNNVGNLKMKHDLNKLTQFSDSNGRAKVTEISQDGYGAGELQGVSVDKTGRVSASYTNGQKVDIAQVELVSFNADNMLKKLDGGTFAATTGSGQPILGSSGSIIGGALEASNSDISEEFTKLIVTQQAYSAGTKIVSTSNDMLQAALNMVR